jgi:hypothetical protein
MNSKQQRAANTVLRWTVGLVVLWQSYRFLATATSNTELRHLGMPHGFALALGGVELVAAALFLVPRLSRLGGCVLLAVFAVACAIHALHGQFAIGALLVYAAAVAACLASDSELAGTRP